MKYLGLLFITLACSQCQKNEPIPPDPTPIQIDTTEAKVYLNGVLMDYNPKFVSYQGTGVLTYDLIQIRGIFINILGVSGPVPFTKADWGKYLSFGQYKNIDYGNHVYRPIDRDSSIFKVTEIDTITRDIKGVFQAKFKRKAAGIITPDSYLPDTLSFKGVFHTKYIVY